MKRIGILSDTHSSLHKGIYKFLKECDEIWHIGDIGNIEIIKLLSEISPIVAVYGNIDGGEIKNIYKEWEVFHCENVKVLMTHIGGYPKRYDRKAEKRIRIYTPQLFISGHSHILKVMYDDKYNCLHINPGASGKTGFHKKVTAIRLTIDNKDMKDLEVFEAPRSGSDYYDFSF
ncbi:MAG: metallophosphoesterase [Hyphomicrobiales bacterium]